MVEAATLAMIGTGVSAASSVMSGLQAGQAQRSQAKLQQQAAIAESRAAGEEMKQKEREQSRFRSRMLAKFAKAGVAMAGTPMDALMQTAIQQERDLINMRYNTQVRQERMISEANLLKSKARGSEFAGVVEGGAKLLSMPQAQGFMTKKGSS